MKCRCVHHWQNFCPNTNRGVLLLSMFSLPDKNICRAVHFFKYFSKLPQTNTFYGGPYFQTLLWPISSFEEIFANYFSSMLHFSFLNIFPFYAPPFNFFLPVVRIYFSPFCTIQHMCAPQYHLFYALWDRKKYLATLIIDNSRKYPVTEHILNMKEVTFYIFYLDECSSTSILSWK